LARHPEPTHPDPDARVTDQAQRLDRILAERKATADACRASLNVHAQVSVPISVPAEITATPIAPEPAPLEPSLVEPSLAKPSLADILGTASADPPAAPVVPTPQMQAPSAPSPAHDTRKAKQPAAQAAAPVMSGLAHMPEAVRERLGQIGQSGHASPFNVVPPPPLQRPNSDHLAGRGELGAALAKSKDALKAVGWISCAINVLMLAGPLFMLQVYDRVIPSNSLATLAVLTLLTAVVYGLIGWLERDRSRIIIRTGIEIDQRIGNRIFEASLKNSVSGTGTSVQALRELDALRNFVSGPAPMTFFDIWWTPIYLLVIFATHWMLGIASVVGTAILLVLAWASEAQTRAPMQEAGKSAARSLELAETGQRNAEAITAMGMLSAYRARWQTANQEALAWQVLASDRLGTLSAVSKTMRLLLQSLMLALGAALSLKGEISAGAIIAGTIIFGRALAPVEQVITHWKGSIKALESYRKLEALLKAAPASEARTSLPTPAGNLHVSGIRVATPETRTLILSNLNFEVSPGQMLAVIGPSASGKSTLARTLVGLWKPFAGAIKLDGVRLEQWNPEELGQHIGYLPQDIELFAGTVKENISRFRLDVSDDDIVAAAKAAHADEMIMALPQAYETQLGAFGTHLSAGQRQRIALARALFGNPPLVVLDEPNANLDRVGDAALDAAIDGMRSRGQAVVLISHRTQAIGKADTLLYLERGVQRAFGPRAEVMKMFTQAAPTPSAPNQRPTAPVAQTAAAAGGSR
jgi:ATP-binding cassette, subfamily C, bacterial PrsD